MRLVIAVLILHSSTAPALISAEETWKSHRPLRVVPAATNRALPSGPMLVVDAAKGDDGNAGNPAAPLRTVQVAINRGVPGTTVVLRGGVYFERVIIASRGSAEKPITLCSWPGETGVIDGSWPEFSQSPETAWQPVKDGARDEFRSTKSYPNVREAIGAFGDSMIGLNSYFHHSDLQATNELIDYDDWEKSKTTDTRPLWCGPGAVVRRGDRAHSLSAESHASDGPRQLQRRN